MLFAGEAGHIGVFEDVGGVFVVAGVGDAPVVKEEAVEEEEEEEEENQEEAAAAGLGALFG